MFTAGAASANVQQDFDDEVIFKTLRHLNDRKRANQAAGSDQPFLMVTSFIHPHDPYEPPKANWDRFAEVDIPDPAHPEVPDAAEDPHSHRLRTMCGFDQREPGIEDVRRARRAYYAAVNYIDDHVGAIRKRLEELDLAKNTVIIVTSDHGDMLGEKGLWFKMSPYEQSSRVPIIINGPAEVVTPGRYANPVSLVDLAPTLLEIARTGSDAASADGGADASAGAASAIDEGLVGTSLLESARREATENSDPRTGMSSSNTSPKAPTARRSRLCAETASSRSARAIRLCSSTSPPTRMSWSTGPRTPPMRRRCRRCGRSSSPATTSTTSRSTCSGASRAGSSLPMRSRSER